MRTQCSLRAQIRRVREYIRENPTPENNAKLRALEKELQAVKSVDDLFRAVGGFPARSR